MPQRSVSKRVFLLYFAKGVVINRTKNSGAEGSRTLDLCIANAALSQLSYRPNEAVVYRLPN
jgi:hypothetical protein